MKALKEFVDILESNASSRQKEMFLSNNSHFSMELVQDDNGTLMRVFCLMKCQIKVLYRYHPKIASDFLYAKCKRSLDLPVYDWCHSVASSHWAFSHQHSCHDDVWVPRCPKKERTPGQVKKNYGYLSKMRHATLRVQNEEPNYSGVSDFKYLSDPKLKELEEHILIMNKAIIHGSENSGEQ